MATAAARTREIAGLMALGAVLFAAGIVVGGAIALWWFLAGPGREAADRPAPVRTPPLRVAAPIEPIPAPPIGIFYPLPADPVPPLPAIPADERPPIPVLDAAGKPARCTFNGGEDPIQNAVRDALRAKERDLRLCAMRMDGETTIRFAFRVAANASEVSGVSPRSSSGLELCVKPLLSVPIATAEPAPRLGEIKITMWGPAGKDLCNVQVAAKKID